MSALRAVKKFSGKTKIVGVSTLTSLNDKNLLLKFLILCKLIMEYEGHIEEKGAHFRKHRVPEETWKERKGNMEGKKEGQ